MGVWLKIAGKTAVVFLLTWSVGAGAQERGDIERLPISGMIKVTNSDGAVVYMSDDRRFVFRGEMIDLWKGQAIEADMSVSQEIDWDRNGVSIDKIGFPLSKKAGRKALFISPGCDDCRELIKYVLEEGVEDLNVVLLASSQKEHEQNAQVWCSSNRIKALRTVLVEGQNIEKNDLASFCDRFGLMLAEQAAMLFGIGQLPMYVDEAGMGHTGENAIFAMKRAKNL